MLNCVTLTLFFIAKANIILPFRKFQIETGEIFVLQSVNIEEEAQIESLMGCSLKCVNMCYQFSQGIAAVQCTQQCGCKDLLIPVLIAQQFSNFSVESTQADDWNIDNAILNQRKNNAEFEAESTIIHDSNDNYKETDAAEADLNSKEFKYKRTSIRNNNTTEKKANEILRSEWESPSGNSEDNSQTIIIESNKEMNLQKYNDEGTKFKHKKANNISQNNQNENGLLTFKDGKDFNSEDENQGNFTDGNQEYRSNNDAVFNDNSEYIYKGEENLNWDIIRAININSIQKKLSSCKISCLNSCKNIFGDKTACANACNANFCRKNQAKIILEKLNMKSFGVWGWILTIAILGVIISMFLNRMIESKPRRVILNDFTWSSASYKILV